MPAQSQAQRGLIFGKRNQYGSKAKTPKKWQWIWDEDWENKGKLPKKKKKNETVQNIVFNEDMTRARTVNEYESPRDESLQDLKGYDLIMTVLQKTFSPGLFKAVKEELSENSGSVRDLLIDNPEVVKKIEKRVPGISDYGLIDKWFLIDTVMYDGDDEELVEVSWWKAQEILMETFNFKRMPINSEYYDEILLDPEAKIGYIEAEKDNPYQSAFNIWIFEK